ncbi:MAG: Hsp33 family molecular chaperone HslO [bacterium]|nr:Hsp33 family molecular chaperone HslO [bacterium]
MQTFEQELQSNFFTTGIIPDLNFRFVLARNNSAAAEAAERLGTSSALEALLGETMLAAFFLVTHSVKTKDTVSLHLEGSGPAHRIIAFADTDGAMRATTARPTAVWDGDLWQGVGSGILRVNRWRDDQQSYSSAVEMRDVGLGKNLQEFIARSDQIQTFLRLETSFENSPQSNGETGRGADGQGKVVRNVSGFMFQALPGAGADEIDEILNMIGERTPDEMITALLQPADEAGGTFRPGTVASHPVKILKNGSFHYHCDCNLEKVSKVLYLMGRESISDLAQENGCVEVFCEFCKKRYELSPAEVDELFLDR